MLTKTGALYINLAMLNLVIYFEVHVFDIISAYIYSITKCTIRAEN